MSSQQIVKSTGAPLDRARLWSGLDDDELKRRASVAANTKDANELWGLLDAYLTLYGGAGSKTSAHTIRAYRRGLDAWLEYADGRGVNLLRPGRDTGVDYKQHLETSLSAASVRVRLAAVRLLCRALRWSGATSATPFENVKPRRDKTASKDKKRRYEDRDVEQLIAHAEPRDELLVLLCGHAGLRVAEACALRWSDIDGAELTVRGGKGDKDRRVKLSRRLAEALGNADRTADRVVPITPTRARARLKTLADRAGVVYRGVHALRHYAGTRLYGQTKSLNHVADHLGHASIETTRDYIGMADDTIKDAVADW